MSLFFSGKRVQNEINSDFANRMKIQGINFLNVPNSGNVPRLRFTGYTDEWKNVKIADIATIVGGGTPDTTISEYWDGDIQWFTPSEIGKSKYIAKSDRTITKEGLNNSSAKILPKGTILLSTRATIGECSIADKECCTNQGFQSIIVKNNTTNEFQYYLIQTKKKDLIRNACGSTFLEISANEVRKIRCNIPNIKEQRKIADFLSLLDKRIETHNKIIQQLQSLIKGIRVNLFSFDNYSIKYLGELCSITTGKLDANAMVVNGKYPFFTCAEETFRIDEYAFDTEALLISGNGANLGYIHYYNGKFNAYQRTYVLDKFAIDVMYIKYYLETFLNKRINQEVNVGNTPYIVLSTLTKMRIKIPDILIQQRIVTTIKSLKEKLLNEKLALIKYEEQKKFLLSNMFI